MKRYHDFWNNRALVRSSLIGFLWLIISLFINFYSGVYATEKASNSVTDIILSNTRVYDLDGIFVWGSWLVVIFIGVLCFIRPKIMPVIFKSVALFVLIRSVFISLTHIGPFPTSIQIDPQSFINYFVFGGDLFFSGHAGLPFLLALIFWREHKLRYVFLIISACFSIIVLLAHLHYTIDVLSAFFISYGIYHISLKLFAKDYELFASNRG